MIRHVWIVSSRLGGPKSKEPVLDSQIKSLLTLSKGMHYTEITSISGYSDPLEVEHENLNRAHIFVMWFSNWSLCCQIQALLLKASSEIQQAMEKNCVMLRLFVCSLSSICNPRSFHKRQLILYHKGCNIKFKRSHTVSGSQNNFPHTVFYLLKLNWGKVLLYKTMCCGQQR